ncbi:hypothetical protein DYB37_010718 [Aphanomyces astaci]|nr:hypothetical protein AaE_009453 [Aphanomyces astaci]RHY04016.1 hypothetical protein DYB36_008755 [Aphanomyces astaci]RHY10525.1 hypothetical protein DYB25_013005 [Aphanomyces astaci]RHY70243.1 hypothetical protein DYB38_008148 [Aphanomyces astaci]RHY70660.1 hypothetical protein DYB34_008782 [Aphanomyces astaci]
MGRARKVIHDLIVHTRGLVRNRGIEDPGWLECVNRYPPPPMPRVDRDKIPTISFPQDRLAELYAAKSGYATDDETAYEFADEQLTLIEMGIPEKEAYATLATKYQKVEAERFLQNFYQMRGQPFIPSTKPEEMAKRWEEDEAAAIKEGMRMELQDKQELESDTWMIRK